MKILILSTKLPYPPKDGGAMATLSLARGLSAAGNDVTILAINTTKHYYPADKIPSSLKEEVQFIEVKHDTSIKPLQALKNIFFSKMPYIAARFYSKSYSDKLESILSTNSFDIIQFEGPYLGVYLTQIKKFSGDAKLSLRAHNVEHNIWTQRWKSDTRILFKPYLKNMTDRIRNLESKLLNELDALIAISDEDKSRLHALNKDIISITIPTGIELDKYNMNDPVIENSIFFLGSLDWSPNQEGLSWFVKKVLPLIKDQRKDLAFHVAGRNAPDAIVELLTKPSIVFHGEVEDAATFMSRYNIMVVPLQTGSGIRIKILEGMALKKSIVTTSVGAEGLPVRNGEQIFIANDAKAFAMSVVKLLENKDLNTATGNKAHTVIRQKFDTFTIATRLEDFYKKLA